MPVKSTFNTVDIQLNVGISCTDGYVKVICKSQSLIF